MHDRDRRADSMVRPSSSPVFLTTENSILDRNPIEVARQQSFKDDIDRITEPFYQTFLDQANTPHQQKQGLLFSRKPESPKVWSCVRQFAELVVKANSKLISTKNRRRNIPTEYQVGFQSELDTQISTARGVVKSRPQLTLRFDFDSQRTKSIDLCWQKTNDDVLKQALPDTLHPTTDEDHSTGEHSLADTVRLRTLLTTDEDTDENCIQSTITMDFADIPSLTLKHQFFHLDDKNLLAIKHVHDLIYTYNSDEDLLVLGPKGKKELSKNNITFRETIDKDEYLNLVSASLNLIPAISLRDI